MIEATLPRLSTLRSSMPLNVEEKRGQENDNYETIGSCEGLLPARPGDIVLDIVGSLCRRRRPENCATQLGSVFPCRIASCKPTVEHVKFKSSDTTLMQVHYHYSVSRLAKVLLHLTTILATVLRHHYVYLP
jgi:hypothetical protein